MIRNFNADGFGSLYPKYKGGRPPKFTLPQRREVKKIAKSQPGETEVFVPCPPDHHISRGCIACDDTGWSYVVPAYGQ